MAVTGMACPVLGVEAAAIARLGLADGSPISEVCSHDYLMRVAINAAVKLVCKYPDTSTPLSDRSRIFRSLRPPGMAKTLETQERFSVRLSKRSYSQRYLNAGLISLLRANVSSCPTHSRNSLKLVLSLLEPMRVPQCAHLPTWSLASAGVYFGRRSACVACSKS